MPAAHRCCVSRQTPRRRSPVRSSISPSSLEAAAHRRALPGGDLEQQPHLGPGPERAADLLERPHHPLDAVGDGAADAAPGWTITCADAERLGARALLVAASPSSAPTPSTTAAARLMRYERVRRQRQLRPRGRAARAAGARAGTGPPSRRRAAAPPTAATSASTAAPRRSRRAPRARRRGAARRRPTRARRGSTEDGPATCDRGRPSCGSRP